MPDMEITQRNAMELEPHRWCIDASELGIAPGAQYPAYIPTKLGNGQPFGFTHVDGNGSHHYAQPYGCIRLTVWND